MKWKRKKKLVVVVVLSPTTRPEADRDFNILTPTNLRNYHMSLCRANVERTIEL